LMFSIPFFCFLPLRFLFSLFSVFFVTPFVFPFLFCFLFPSDSFRFLIFFVPLSLSFHFFLFDSVFYFRFCFCSDQFMGLIFFHSFLCSGCPFSHKHKKTYYEPLTHWHFSKNKKRSLIH
jgi:hypothetical protein